jgi:hypothetical protein
MPGDFIDDNDFSKFGAGKGQLYGDEDDDEIVGEL